MSFVSLQKDSLGLKKKSIQLMIEKIWGFISNMFVVHFDFDSQFGLNSSFLVHRKKYLVEICLYFNNFSSVFSKQYV